MKRLISALLALCVTASFLLLPGCGPSAETVQLQFDEFIQELPSRMLSPGDMDLNYLFRDKASFGFADEAYSLPFATAEDYERDLADTGELIRQLESFPARKLREDQQLTRDVALDFFRRNSKLNDYYDWNNSYLGSFIGFQAQLPMLLGEYHFDSKSDLENYFHILESFPSAFTSYADMEARRQEHGVGLPQCILDKVVEQCRNFSGEDRPYLVDEVNDKISGLSFLTEEEKDAARQKNERLLVGSMVPAYIQLGDRLASMHSDNPDLGLSSQPDGAKYYEALLQSRTGVDMTVPQVKGYLEDKRNTLLSQARKLLQEHPSIQEKINAGEGVSYGSFQSARENIDYLHNQLGALYPALPALNYQVKQVPSALQENFSPAAYLQGRLDDPPDTPEMIYLNGGYQSSLFSTIAHEGYPGHMYQHSYFKSKQPPAVRMLLDYNGYSEGWATYVENNCWQYTQAQGEDLVYLQFQSIWTRIQQASIALFDIGIHYDGWDRVQFKQQVEQVFGAGAMAEDALREQYDLTLETPTNYLQYYFNGFLFQDQYDRAEQALGESFDPVAFHDVILSTGPAPYTVIQAQVDRYIKSARAPQTSPARIGAGGFKAYFPIPAF